MTPRLPSVKPRQIIQALERVGFGVDHQTGSHVVLRRASCPQEAIELVRDPAKGEPLEIQKLIAHAAQLA